MNNEKIIELIKETGEFVLSQPIVQEKIINEIGNIAIALKDLAMPYIIKIILPYVEAFLIALGITLLAVALSYFIKSVAEWVYNGLKKGPDPQKA